MQQRLMGRLAAPMILALGLALMAPMAASAAPAPIVGVIDVSKARNEFKGWRAAQARMDAMNREKQGIYDDLEKGRGLSPQEFKEYQQLAGDVVKINPIRIKQLQDLSQKNSAELADLQAKSEELAGLKARADDKAKPLSDAEKARLDALAKELTPEKQDRQRKLETDGRAVSELINAEGNTLYEQLQAEGARLTKALDDLIDKGTGKVAEAKKLALVVAKDVQVGDGAVERFVRWGGLDITADVIKHLNDTFKDSMLDAPNG